MTLSDIAAGVAVTTEQREQGVASVDDTDDSLAERLAALDGELPVSPSVAATVLEAYAAGNAVGDAGRAAGVAPLSAAKTLHRLGESVQPLGPTGQDVLEDWLEGRLSRSEARALAGVGENTFALAAYVATHDPIPGARAATEGALASADATREKRAALGDAVEPGDALR